MPAIFIKRSEGPGSSLVAGVESGAAPRPFRSLVVDDIYTLSVYLVDGIGDYSDISGDAGYTVRVAVGTPGASPDSGTWPLTCGVNTASDLDWDISAAALESALNNLTSVINAGGVDVIGTAPFFAVTWRETGTKPDFTSGANTLSPTSFVKIEVKNDGSAGANKEVYLFLCQYPLSEQTSSEPITDGWALSLSLKTLAARAATSGLEFLNSTISIAIVDGSGYEETEVLCQVQILVPPGMSNPTSTWSPTPAGFSEADPVFAASPAAGITTTNISNWDEAYSWGDHANAGYAAYQWVLNTFLSLGGGTLSGPLGVYGAPPSCAALATTSTTKGWLPPRMTLTERNNIASPETGLFIFQTNGTAGYYYYDGSNWVPIGAGAAATAYNPDTSKTSPIYYTGTGQDRLLYFGPET